MKYTAHYFSLIMFLLIFLSGCGPPLGSHNFYSDKRFPAKPLNAPIEIIQGKVDRPYIAIGDVSAFEPVGFFRHQADGQEAIARLKKMAREMGGDAIIKFTSSVGAPGTVGAGHYSAQGVVVRWK